MTRRDSVFALWPVRVIVVLGLFGAAMFTIIFLSSLAHPFLVGFFGLTALGLGFVVLTELIRVHVERREPIMPLLPMALAFLVCMLLLHALLEAS